MPRPRKSRVAPSQPTATSSSATPPVIVKPISKDPSSDIYDVSDREKERAKRAAAVAAAQRHMDSDQAKALEDAKQRRDLTMDRLVNMSSTTGTANTDENHDTAIRQSPRAPRRLIGDTSGLDLDDDMFDLNDSLEDPTITAQNAGGYRSANTSSFDVGLFQRHRPRQNNVPGRDDGPVRPSSRGPTTPSVMSTLNLGLFKRRAREPSILGTAQNGRRQRSQSVTSQVSRIPMTDEEDNMDVDREAVIEDGDSGPDGESTPIGRTKRRSGASAFAGAASGADITIPASSGAIPVDEEEAVMTETPSQRSKKRKSLESHPGRNKRGRSSVHQDSVPELEQEEENEVIHQSIEMRDGGDSPTSSPLSTPGASPLLDPMQHSPPRQSRPPLDPNDPVNAPPASDSSEAGSPVAWPSLNNLTHRSYNTRRAAPVYTERLQTPELLPVLGPGPAGGVLDEDMLSELSSPPSLTHSPNYKAPSIAKAAAAAGAATKKAGATKKKEEEKLATEALTSLLPARRHHATKSDKKKNKKGGNKENPYDISSDDDSSLSSSEDDTMAGVDELSYVATAASRRKREKALTAAENQKQKGKEKKKPPLGTTTNGKAAAAAGKSKSASSEPKRTYGRASSDKENGASGSGDNGEEDGDNDDQEPVSAMDLDETKELPETTQMMTERLGEELQKAAKKFKEVDKWELSFEEVTQPSSPVPDAR